jgi:hypothetical protein
MTIQMLIFFLVYLAALLSLFTWLFLQRKRRREGRFPVPEDFRAMRRPGESLSAALVKLSERFNIQFALMLAGPLIGLALPFLLVNGAGVAAIHFGTVIAALALVLVGLLSTLPRLMKTVETIRDCRLGLFGERLVADQLTELQAHGFQVFHDVPCLGGGGRFNLDHVVVGQGKVVVVETKTYRKPKNVEGTNHKVTYDGQRLCWPNRTSTNELEQVLRNAEWLKEELKKKLGLAVSIRAALTMPGWFVTGASPKAPVLVVSTRQLSQHIRERFRDDVLSKTDENLINNHLRSFCETVDFDSMPDGV